MSCFNLVPKDRCLLFWILGFTDVVVGMIYSVQGPIYPLEAQKRNATATEYGLVFGIFQLTQIFAGPIVGGLGPDKCIFIGGIYTTAISTILFGFLDFLTGRTLFICVSLLLRFLDGVGASVVYVCIYSILALEFPESASIVIGVMESISAVGFSVGPFFGSALYQIGGFILPFHLLGGLILITGTLVYCSVTNQKYTNLDRNCNNCLSIMFQLPSIALHMCNVVLVLLIFGFNESLLQAHLLQFNLAETTIGLIYSLYAIPNAITPALFGYLVAKLKRPELIPLVGLALSMIGLSLIGPAPFIIPLKPSVGLILVGLLLNGTGIAAVVSTTFYLAIQETKYSSLKYSYSTSCQVSGLYLASCSLGLFIGPSLGGALHDIFGFAFSSLILVVFNFIQFGIFIVFTCSKKIHQIEENRSLL